MRARPHRLLWLWCVLTVAVTANVAAQPVPPGLEPWRGWVLRGQEFRACPLIAGHRAGTADDFLCAWPGVLELNADEHGADITQHWRVEAEAWLPLPGDDEHWPQQVTVDGQPAPVVHQQGPSVRVAAGSHAIRARIPWNERPQTMQVPSAVGLVVLSVDGKPVVPVQRDANAVTLGRAKAAAPESDSLDVRVYRKLSDGVPALLTTVIQLDASGQAREVVIGPALPDGFAPLTLDSEAWPARLDADGRLRVQVQPGSDTINLDARATAPLSKVVARVPAAPWPQQEIWSYEAAPMLRVTAATSALQIDPRQSAVPDEWNALPAFALADAATLTVEERSRGLAPDDRNRLTLDREMWLDFSGAGWFARDRIGGEMLRGWRFDLAPPLTLERAAVLNSGDAPENLLVTRGAAAGTTGVEWRTPAVGLGAGVRIASGAAKMPVTGWQDSFDRVTTTLHLPSGYKLLGAPGADSATGSWIAGWTLLDVFIAAIIALLAWRLFGVIGAAIAIGYLVLAYQESGAPLWTLVAALALGLIARALPAGRLANAAAWIRRVALLLLVLVALPFVAQQMRYALHPQLEGGGFTSYTGVAGGFAPMPKPAAMQNEAREQAPAAEAPAAPPVSRSLKTVEEAKDKLETVTVTGSRVRRVDLLANDRESTVVQTGAGEPDWNFANNYVLAWSGPVLPAQDVRLVIAPPWLVRMLRVALVALLVVLIGRLLRGVVSMPPRAAAAMFGGAIVLSALSMPMSANAQAFPPDYLLNELRAQLIDPPACAPGCATIAKAEIGARDDQIRVALEAHAATRVALPVPGDSQALALRSVTVDGAAQDALARSKDQLLIGLARGVHRIELVYTAAADKVALSFPLKPMRAEFSGEGWQASGINDDRLLTETVSLARERDAAQSGATPAGAQQFAPFVRVDREITLGLDWSISTGVHRLAPKEGGFTVSVPALAGEHVSTPGIKTDGGRITAALAEGEQDTAWSSTLDKSDTLTLTAPALTDHAEVWRVTASAMWHLETSGVPMTTDADAADDDYRRFEFHPLPGETLTLRITKPQAAEGATRAVDRASLIVSAGQRASDAVLDIGMRASQGGDQVITLPADAEVMSVSRNGQVLNLRPVEGRLTLPLVPGTQQFQIRFREPVAVGLITRTPAVALGLPSANLDLGIDLSADRWLLATSGPSQGPAVMYWSELLVMLLVAFALARTRRTPLTLAQWILLGIGFSTFSWLALLVIVAWLFALDWRARYAPPMRPALFNLVQVGLALLTIVALLCIVAAIPQGLLGTPDMHVAGNGSSAASLRWFADRGDVLPYASAISVPLWVYKLAMLAWAIWLANALVGWLRKGFDAWTRGGYWRAPPPKSVVEIPAAPAPPRRP